MAKNTLGALPSLVMIESGKGLFRLFSCSTCHTSQIVIVVCTPLQTLLSLHLCDIFWCWQSSSLNGCDEPLQKCRGDRPTQLEVCASILSQTATNTHIHTHIHTNKHTFISPCCRRSSSRRCRFHCFGAWAARRCVESPLNCPSRMYAQQNHPCRQ